MIGLLYPILVSALLAVLFIKLLRPLARRFDLVDRPNERKHHVGSTPLVGGMAIYLAVIITSQLFFVEHVSLNAFLLAAGAIVLLGVADDHGDLPVSHRLIAQTLIALVMIFGAGVSLHNFGDLLGLGELRMPLALAVPITVLAVIAAINAFNMVDGIDGLAGGLSLVTFIATSLLFTLAERYDAALFCLSLSSAMIGYLAINLGWAGRKRKVFMGDAGSMFIGLCVIWLLAMGSQGDNPAFRPATALWLIAIPLMDMVGIMFRRVRKGQSPFLADRNHLHHIFLRAGFTDRESLLIIYLLALLMAMTGVIADRAGLPDSLSLFGFLLVFAFYNYSLSHVWRLLRLYHRVSGRKPLHD